MYKLYKAVKSISKRQQAINKLEQELAVDAHQKRKDDTRRKILIGALTLGKMQHNPAYRKQIMKELDNFLEREGERKLFNLD